MAKVKAKAKAKAKMKPKPAGKKSARKPAMKSAARKTAAKARSAKPKRVSYIPEGTHAITPHLIMKGASQAIDFYRRAFGATEIYRMPGPDGHSVMHAELRLGDSIFFLCDEFPMSDTRSPQTVGGTTFSMHVYTPDVDALFQKAVAAGAKVVMPPADMFWGDRYAKVTDPYGHSWSLATHKEDVSPEQMAERAATAFSAAPGGGSATASTNGEGGPKLF